MADEYGSYDGDFEAAPTEEWQAPAPVHEEADDATASTSTAATTHKSPPASRIPQPTSFSTSPGAAANNLALSRLNKNLESLKARGVQMGAEHEERVASRGGPLSPRGGTANTLTEGSGGGYSGGYSAEHGERLKRELNTARAKLAAAQKTIDDLTLAREEDAVKLKKVSRSDQGKLNAQQLATATKKIDIYKKANEVLRNQVNSALNPDKYHSLINRISEQEAYAAAMAEENKTLKAEIRRLSKEFEQANEAAGDAPAKIASGLDEITRLRDKAKAAAAKQSVMEKTARKQQEQVVGLEEKYRRAQAQILELERKLKDATHNSRLALATDSEDFSSPLAAADSPNKPATSTSAKPVKRKTPRVTGAPAVVPTLALATSVADSDKAEIEERERLAEARAAEGIRTGGASSTRSGPGTGKKPKPTTLGKLPAPATTEAKPLSPSPPAQPKPKKSTTSAAAGKTVRRPAPATTTTTAAPVAAEEKAIEPPAEVGAPVSSGPEDTTPSWLKKANASAKNDAPAPAPAPAVAAAEPFDVDSFLGLPSSTAATAPSAADAYASKPKHKSDTPPTQPAAVAAAKPEDSTPAWLRSSSTTQQQEPAASESSLAAAVADWLASPSTSASTTTTAAPVTTKPASPPAPTPARVSPVPPPAAVAAPAEIGGRRARGPGALARQASTAGAAAPAVVEEAAAPTPAPAAPVHNVEDEYGDDFDVSNMDF